ncbi:MAG: phosphoenolpyruvate--protein phosphotransferase [Proteobacteria bacterium]|nr:phosphoenolpyruvate--protein phosphotransferase [Pseudomonadota bacterium]
MAARELTGQPAAPGIALGPIVRIDPGPAGPARAAGTPAQEAAALEAAAAAALRGLADLQAAAQDDEAAAILEFQIEMLRDPALLEPAMQAIGAGMPADAALHAALGGQIEDFAAAEDAYFRARADDLRDLRDRVLRHLTGAAGARAAMPPGGILAGADLTPSRFLETDWRAGGGIALAGGSPASHVAMLARARGVPMAVGLGTLALEDHAEALVDGDAGRVVLDPGAAERAAFAARAATRQDARAAPDAAARGPAVTADGIAVRVLLNIAHPAELDGLDPAICDGIGLVRTELLFGGASGPPDEEAQYRAYRAIADWAAGRPVTIRTLDAGGDKPVAGLTEPGESNPFLGVRGIRLSLARPEIFAVQLRALARAAAHGEIKVMLPMVTAPAEFRAAREMLATEVAALRAADVACRMPALGIMVEVPAAALAVESFAADFFSIGSNDLTQYVTASARDIAGVAALADPANPAVLRLIAEVAAHGAATGREVSVCGDMAGDPAYAASLLAAGIRSFSMAPNAVGAVKLALAALEASA